MRQKRDVRPGWPHHIVVRGNNRRRLFSYPSEMRTFIWHVGRALEREGCLLHALLLMINHVHLIATPPLREALGRFVKAFTQRYAQQRNRRRGASGKLFEERFWSKPILDDEQLSLSTVYVELNPVRAGMAADPSQYPWSTCGLHLGDPSSSEIPSEIWRPSPWYFGLGSTPQARVEAYRRWLTECHVRELLPQDAERLAELETASAPYRFRLRRPDGSSAAEPRSPYGGEGMSFVRRSSLITKA